MNAIRQIALPALAAVTLFAATIASAAPTETIRAGATTVKLDHEFLKALASLNVAPAPLSPAKLFAKRGDPRIAFPITTGASDLGGPKAEIAHAGGLSLTTNETRVELSSFIIDVTSGAPRLTGLVVANDNVVGRIPLFDLSLAPNSVSVGDSLLRISDVSVKLSVDAADALNRVFGVKAFAEGIEIGNAKVRAFLDNEH